jgi:hypothetical protein
MDTIVHKRFLIITCVEMYINIDLESIYIKFYLYSQKYACAHVD